MLTVLQGGSDKLELKSTDLWGMYILVKLEFFNQFLLLGIFSRVSVTECVLHSSFPLSFPYLVVLFFLNSKGSQVTLG